MIIRDQLLRAQPFFQSFPSKIIHSTRFAESILRAAILCPARKVLFWQASDYPVHHFW